MIEYVVEFLDVTFPHINWPAVVPTPEVRHQIDDVRKLRHLIPVPFHTPRRAHKQHIPMKIPVKLSKDILVSQRQDDLGLQV